MHPSADGLLGSIYHQHRAQESFQHGSYNLSQAYANHSNLSQSFGYGGGGFDPYNHGGLGRRPIMQRFDEYYRCYPVIMAPGNPRPDLNYGSKIILPPSALDKVSKLHVQWPLLMELINGEKEKSTHAGVLEFIAEEGRAYIPQWVCCLQWDTWLWTDRDR